MRLLVVLIADSTAALDDVVDYTL